MRAIRVMALRAELKEHAAQPRAPPTGSRPWFGWATDYADEGYTPVDAVDEAEAQRKVRRILCADDNPAEPMPTSVRPITAQDVDVLQDEIERLTLEGRS